MSERLAVVTGAAGGMGRAITEALIADGLSVAGVEVDAEGLAELAAGHPDRFHPCPADLTDPEAIARVFAELANAFGGGRHRVRARTRRESDTSALGSTQWLQRLRR